MKKLTTLSLIILISLFTGCATVDRGNFSEFSARGTRSAYNFYSYDVIDTSKEDISIPKPPHTPIVERFEVRDGDCSGLDCSRKGSERYELQEQRPRNTYDGSEYWYTWDIYFPKDYKTIAPSRTVLGQFFQQGSVPAFWFFERNGYRFYNRMKKEYLGALIPDKDLRGKWHTLVLHVKWSKDPKVGFFKIWVDGKQKFDYHNKTMTANIVFFEYGIYRNDIQYFKNSIGEDEKWKNIPEYPTPEFWVKFYTEVPDVKVPTQIIYYSNVRRASTKDGLNLKQGDL